MTRLQGAIKVLGGELNEKQTDSTRSVQDSGRPLRVAVIDDDPNICVIIRMFFGRNGVEVVEAYSGMRGILLVRRERPDVVLLDVMLPDIDGYEVCRRLKLDPVTKEIPIIFISALSQADHMKLGLLMGAEDFIVKPFSPVVLLEKIRAMAWERTGSMPASRHSTALP